MSIIGLFFPSSVYPNDKSKVIKESTQELGVDLVLPYRKCFVCTLENKILMDGTEHCIDSDIQSSVMATAFGGELNYC